MKTKTRIVSLFAATLTAIALHGTASSATIGLNFLRGAGADAPGMQDALANSLLATDVAGAGAYAQANWNNLGFQGTNIAVLDSAGAATTVAVNWTSGNAWSQGGGGTPTAQGSPDPNLMNSYLDNNGNANVAIVNPYNIYTGSANNKPLVYLAGLGAWMAAQGAVAYDLVIYSDGDATSGRVGEYWAVNATGTPDALTVGPDLSTHVFVCDIQNFIANPVYSGVPLSVQNNALPGVAAQMIAQYGNFPGNYTVLQSLTNDTVLLRSQRNNTRAPINALQIIPRATILPATIYGMYDAPVYAGGKARFFPVVGGGAPMTFQWLKNGNPLTDGGNITGSATANLTVSSVSSGDVAAYSLVVTTSLGVVTSTPAQLTLVAPVAGSYPQKIATNAPYAYWRFNETQDAAGGFTPAYDAFGGCTATYGIASQNGFNSIPGPVSAQWPGFESGNLSYASSRPSARWIAGSAPASAYLLAPPLLLNTNTATFTAWIYPTAAQAGFTGLLFTRGVDVAGFGYGNNNMLGYTWNSNNAATYNFVSNLVPRTNEWNFVALTISPSNAIFYCYNTNGQLSATNTITHSNEFWGGPTFIGADAPGGGVTTPQNRGFVGNIDEVAIFNRTLSATEVYDYYKKGLGLSIIQAVISKSPDSSGLMEGRSAKFTVVASGDAPLSYRWRKNGIDLSDGGTISGVTTPTLKISPVAMGDIGSYDVVVNNIANVPVASAPATLTVVVTNSAPTAYEAAIRAANPVAYWRMNETSGTSAFDYWGGDIAAHNQSVVIDADGPQSPAFLGMETTNKAAQYDGLAAGSSASASLLNNRTQFSVIGWFNSPAQLQQNRAGLFGQNDVCEFGFHGTATLEAQQVGVWTPSAGAYLSVTNITPDQWYLIAAVGNGSSVNLYLVSTNNGGTILQATGTGSTTNYGSSAYPFRMGGDGILDATGNFFAGKIDEVAVFDRALTSEELADLLGKALVGGDLPPVITSQPAAATTLYAGRTFTLTTTAVGKKLHYQWRKGGVPITDSGNVSGTATNILTITNVAAANSGDYDLVVTNSAGTVTSLLANLTVIQPTPGGFEAAVIAANPRAYYRFGEMDDPSTNAVSHDYVGGYNGIYGAASQNGYNGIAGPRPTDWLFETTNTAVQTTVSTLDSYTTATFGSLSTNTVTFTMWINPAGLQEAWSGLLMSRGATAGGLGYNGDQMLAYTWNSDSTWSYVSGLVPPTNQWSFVALVVEPTQATLYLCNTNGVQTAVNAVAHASDVFGTWQIGHDNQAGTATRTFNGAIDEVAVYTRSLTKTEIEALFAAGGGMVPTTLNIEKVGNNVVLSWPRGTLLQANEVIGPWTTNNVTSPFTNAPTGSQMFYRIIVK
jgi:hypothetical protein